MTLKFKILTAIFAIISLGLFYTNFSRIQCAYYGCPISHQAGNQDYFAQNNEDYILSIVFADVKNGTYVDVGAYDPIEDSVTKYFYDRNWHGINIEPIPNKYLAFVNQRPLDINLNIGASDKTQQISFYFIPNSGLSTFDINIANHAKRDGFPYEVKKVPVTTLNQILSSHPLKEINFVKIDVEGFEKNVLLGLNLKKYRPQVFIIEATEPRTSIPSHQQWEPILLTQHYHYAYFDGLNRYYVADEHPELLQKFQHVGKCCQL